MQAAAPPVSAAVGGFTGGGSQLPVVPPDAFFVVWSVPVVGGLVCALWGLPPRRAAAWPYRQVQVPLSVAQIGFAAWLAAASSPWPWPWASVPIFVVMLAALVVALRSLGAPSTADAPVGEASAMGRNSSRRTETVSRMLLGTTVGVYAGWSTAAVWVNAATVLPRSGLELSDAAWTALQCAVVAAAGATAVAGSRLLRGQLPYVTTVAYALVGVCVSAARANVPALLVTAGCALAVVVAVTARTRAHR